MAGTVLERKAIEMKASLERQGLTQLTLEEIKKVILAAVRIGVSCDIAVEDVPGRMLHPRRTDERQYYSAIRATKIGLSNEAENILYDTLMEAGAYSSVEEIRELRGELNG